MVKRAIRCFSPTLLVLAAAGLAHGQDCPTVLTETALEAPAAGAAPSSGAGTVRLADIKFVGNHAIGDGRLRARMRMKRERFWRPARHSEYGEERWKDDHRRLCALYRERGRVTARVGPPELSDAPGRSPAGVRRVVLTVPVIEGPLYRLGELALQGVSALDAERARRSFDLAPGDPYDHTRLEEGLRRLKSEYGRRGFAEWRATVRLAPDPERAVLDVRIHVEEGGRWLVGRILFRGHRDTLDRTLRREMLLDEGDLLDTGRLAESVRRLDALGYVTVKQVRLAASPRAPQALDVTLEVEERPPLRHGLSAGVSGLEGASLTATVGTVNLLGRGERMFGSAEVGQAVTAFGVDLSRPHAFGSAWTLGAYLRQERLEFEEVPDAGLPPYRRDESVARVEGQRSLGARGLLLAGYSLGRVTLAAREGPEPEGFGRRVESRLFASAFHDGWDHPWKPRRGLRASVSAQLAGGALGGGRDDADGWARAFGLRPLGRRAAFGLGLQAGALADFGQEAVPFDARYLLGGENQLRGFDVRTVGPRDAAGALRGGTRFLVAQAECHLDLTGWLRALAFVDAGRAWAEDEPLRLEDLRASTGLELRFPLPVFKLPVRLIFAANPARDGFHPRRAFKVVVGPVF